MAGRCGAKPDKESKADSQPLKKTTSKTNRAGKATKAKK